MAQTNETSGWEGEPVSPSPLPLLAPPFDALPGVRAYPSHRRPLLREGELAAPAAWFVLAIAYYVLLLAAVLTGPWAFLADSLSLRLARARRVARGNARDLRGLYPIALRPTPVAVPVGVEESAPAEPRPGRRP